jgi:hypothetical protein
MGKSKGFWDTILKVVIAVASAGCVWCECDELLGDESD